MQKSFNYLLFPQTSAHGTRRSRLIEDTSTAPALLQIILATWSVFGESMFPRSTKLVLYSQRRSTLIQTVLTFWKSEMGSTGAAHYLIATVAPPRPLRMSFLAEERCLYGLSLTAIFVPTMMAQSQDFELHTSLHVSSQVC